MTSSKSKKSAAGPEAHFAFLARVAGKRGLGPAVALTYFLIVVILGLVMHVNGDLEAESDFFESYVAQARSFLDRTIAIDPYRGPLYPIALAFLYLPLQLLGLGLFETGIVLSAVAAAIVLSLTHRLLKILISPQVALGATLLVATNWIFFRYSYTTGNDMFFAAVATAAIYVFARPAESTWKQPVIGGVLAGLTYLTRYNGVAVPIVLLASIVLINAWRQGWTKRAVSGLLFACALGATILPWTVYCKGETGRYFYNQNYKNMAYGFYMTTEETTEQFMKIHGDSFDGFADVITHNPRRILQQLPFQLRDHSLHVMARVASWPIAVFALAGILSLFVRRHPRRLLVYFLTGAIFYLLLILVFYADRFMLLLIPMMCALATLGFEATSRESARRLKTQPFADFLLATLVVYSLFSSVVYNRERIRGTDIGYRPLAERFLRDTPEQLRGSIVAARKAHFGHFAGLTTVGIPMAESHAELMEYLREARADYLLYSVIAANTRRPLTYLTDPSVKHPGLTPIAVENNSSTGAFQAVLYEVDIQRQ